ncbi:OsmC family protein [Glutamicibacter sp. M10]|uniref:OsmC family protein n=1 Tax=Glutamicibacter sp. M10 TaxID=3023076 RepID=UPI0021C64F9C|nr:OsmC family protein [Glutamicibacter sp. M10]UXN32920.1 OsmC family protein [Glutamicibacter sp. M10]
MPTATKKLSVAEDRSARLQEAGTGWGERISAAPQSAQLTFSVRGEGFDSVASNIRAGKHSFTVDEPAALGGSDIAASPVEYALAALVSCQVVVYRLYAENLGIQVDDVQITADGQLDVRGLFGIDETIRPGFSSVDLQVHIAGPESAERYEELRQAVDAHCPVLDLFVNPVPVTTSVHVVEANN